MRKEEIDSLITLLRQLSKELLNLVITRTEERIDLEELQLRGHVLGDLILLRSVADLDRYNWNRGCSLGKSVYPGQVPTQEYRGEQNKRRHKYNGTFPDLINSIQPHIIKDYISIPARSAETSDISICSIGGINIT